MAVKPLFQLLLGYASLACAAAGLADTLATGDGLRVTFSDGDGSIVRVETHGEPLPLIPGEPGGLSLQVGHALPPSAITSLNFDADGGPWVAAHNADWNDAGPYVTWTPAGGVNGSGYLRIGDGATPGAGMALATRVPVRGGSVVQISWSARAASIESTQILCVRIFDAAGADITPSTTAPAGWGWTSTSQAHTVWGLHNSARDTWEHFEQPYTVPERASAIRVSLRHWTGGDHVVHLDDLRLDGTGGIAWSERISIPAPIAPTQRGFRQSAPIPSQNVFVEADYIAGTNQIQIRIHAQDLSDGSQDRPVRLYWTLPVDASGWTWWDDIDTPRPVTPEVRLSNTFTLAGHAVSYYPFSSISNDEFGLSLATPMDEPVVQRFEYDPAHGLQSVWELGLSAATAKIGPGRADVSATLFQHDPSWGFRAAAQKYHDLFPEFFVKRTTREGAWMYPIPPSQIPNPRDFGFAYFETWPIDADERAVAAANDIGIYYYLEPWLAWQYWGTTADKPSYDDRVNRLEAWAASPAQFATWEPSGGIADSGHLLLGDGVSTGAGMATAAAFPVNEADVLRIAWSARVADAETNQILCIRLFDAEGADITQSLAAPAGWFWSSASQAHVIAGITNPTPDLWETFAYTYPLPAAVAAVRVSLRYWNGGDAYVHLDDLTADGLDTTYLSLLFDADNGTWTSAQNADWDDGGATWLRTPRQQAARAVINSSPLDAAGRYLIDSDSYFWHEFAPGTRNQAWPLNSDPDLAPPNGFDLYRDNWVHNRLEETQGVYIDTGNASGGVGGWENHRREHFATVDAPLTFSWADGSAVQLAPQSKAEFLEPIAAEIRAGGRLMMLNLFAEAMRFHAHDADIMGSEIGQLVESGQRSRRRRTLAGTRIVSNLLQWGWNSPVYATTGEIERFIRGQLFWGFFPAISSAGGPMTGGAPDRYFLHPELYERDRPLFQRYMPVIQSLSAAGWTPVTHAVAMPDAEIERFGDFSAGQVWLTVRGADAAGSQAGVTLDLAACGLGPDLILAEARDVLADQPLSVELLSNLRRARFTAALDAEEVGVYRFTAALLGDFDRDGDFDQEDVNLFIFCMQGPDATFAAGNFCLSGDADADRDDDLLDFASFQRAFGN